VRFAALPKLTTAVSAFQGKSPRRPHAGGMIGTRPNITARRGPLHPFTVGPRPCCWTQSTLDSIHLGLNPPWNRLYSEWKWAQGKPGTSEW